MIKRRHKKFIAVVMVMIMCAAVMAIMSGCGKEAVEEKVTYTNPLTGAVTEEEVAAARP